MSAHAIWSNNEILSQILYNLNMVQVAKISLVSKDFYNSDPVQAINKNKDDLCYQQINWININKNKIMLIIFGPDNRPDLSKYSGMMKLILCSFYDGDLYKKHSYKTIYKRFPEWRNLIDNATI